MKCPYCGSEHHKVRLTDNGGKLDTVIRRVRACSDCNETWSTHEIQSIYAQKNGLKEYKNAINNGI